MKNLRRTALPVAILALSLLISGCRQQVENEKGADITDISAVLPDIVGFMGESGAAEIPSDGTVTIDLSARCLVCDSHNSSDIIDCLKQLQRLDHDEYTLCPDIQWTVSVKGDDTVSHYTRFLSDKGYIIVDDYQNCYADSSELSAAVIRGIRGDEQESPAEESGGDFSWFTVECPEPNTEDEYRRAAIDCVEAWLTSLQSEEYDWVYRNKSFEITETDEWGGYKSNYLSCGMVNGRKEFAAEICFTAEDYGDHTFYDAYYQEGRYTEAGTYWSGNYICGRFAWENGKCSLINFTGRDGSEDIQIGLNGINQGEYKTFFDFARRSDLQQAIDSSFVPKSITVSKNLTQTEDGKPINIDIYMDYMEDTDAETADTYTAVWDKRAYINGEPTYSTGLYFTDYGTGHQPDTLPKNFSLTFDNYDGDANPDFCVRYDNDENGTFYCLNSIQTDGRIFSLSGRAFEGGIYIAGCTDPSPRLQKTDTIPYVGWKTDNGRYYPTDENGNETELPDLNMYSDRYYLPDGLRFYSEDENSVTCFLWNNTAVPVTTDAQYSIEYMENGQWKTAAENLPADGITINPREHTEITYDISAIKTRFNTYYRIVQSCGGLTAKGNFCLEGKSVSNVEYKTENVVVGQNIGKFTVTENGALSLEGFSSKVPVPKAVSAKDGSDEYPLTLLHSLTLFNGGGTTDYYYNAADLPKKSGEYDLIIDGEEKGKLKITEPEKIPYLSVNAQIGEGTVDLTLSSDREVSVSYILINYIKNGITVPSPFYYDGEFPLFASENSPLNVNLKNYYDEMGEDAYLEEYGFIMELIKDEETYNSASALKEIGITPDMDFESYKSLMKSYFAIEGSEGCLAEIDFYTVNGEIRFEKYFRF